MRQSLENPQTLHKNSRIRRGEEEQEDSEDKSKTVFG